MAEGAGGMAEGAGGEGNETAMATTEYDGDGKFTREKRESWI